MQVQLESFYYFCKIKFIKFNFSYVYFYYVNNDGFYCTKFVDSFTEAVSYELIYFSDYTTNANYFSNQI